MMLACPKTTTNNLLGGYIELCVCSNSPLPSLPVPLRGQQKHGPADPEHARAAHQRSDAHQPDAGLQQAGHLHQQRLPHGGARRRLRHHAGGPAWLQGQPRRVACSLELRRI